MFAPTQEAKNEKVNTYGKKVKKQKLFERVEMVKRRGVDRRVVGFKVKKSRDVHGFRPPLCVRGPYL